MRLSTCREPARVEHADLVQPAPGKGGKWAPSRLGTQLYDSPRSKRHSASTRQRIRAVRQCTWLRTFLHLVRRVPFGVTASRCPVLALKLPRLKGCGLNSQHPDGGDCCDNSYRLAMLASTQTCFGGGALSACISDTHLIDQRGGNYLLSKEPRGCRSSSKHQVPIATVYYFDGTCGSFRKIGLRGNV